jgi:sterol desaturase/sphingolipid hydroxylase (fatty acid hydroxylase superfamily)
MVTLVAFFAAALALGTLVEYLLHRFFLHARLRHWVVRRHKLHHKTYVRYSIASEFVGFFPPAIPFLWVGFVHSTPAGLAFIAGECAFVLAEAVAHKWSHEAPHRLFWMDPAVHAVHHTAGVRWNYGVLTTFWDRVFGTYRVVPARSPGDAGCRSATTGSEHV